LRKVAKNVVLRLSGGSSSKIPPPGFFDYADSNEGGKKGGGDQLHMEHFDGWTQDSNSNSNSNSNNTGAGNFKQPNEEKTSPFLSTPSGPMVEQVDSITMSYSSSSDTTHGREARDDMAEEGTVSSEDTSTAAPTAAASTKMEAKVESVEGATTASTAAGGVGTLSARKKRHQKYKLRVTEVHAKKDEEERPKNNNSALVAHTNVQMAKRNKVSERLAKSRERFNNRRRGKGGGGGERESTTRDSVASPPPPPPPPPPHHHFHRQERERRRHRSCHGKDSIHRGTTRQ